MMQLMDKNRPTPTTFPRSQRFDLEQFARLPVLACAPFLFVPLNVPTLKWDSEGPVEHSITINIQW
jgi:hypothetical protein